MDQEFQKYIDKEDFGEFNECTKELFYTVIRTSYGIEHPFSKKVLERYLLHKFGQKTDTVKELLKTLEADSEKPLKISCNLTDFSVNVKKFTVKYGEHTKSFSDISEISYFFIDFFLLFPKEITSLKITRDSRDARDARESREKKFDNGKKGKSTEKKSVTKGKTKEKNKGKSEKKSDSEEESEEKSDSDEASDEDNEEESEEKKGKNIEKKGDITVYTDGSCIKNPGKGGWACILIEDELVTEIGKSFPGETTNNKQELTAVIGSLAQLSYIKAFNRKIKIYTDSTYVLNGYKILKKGGKIEYEKNSDLWFLFTDYFKKFKDITMEHVSAHNGNFYNEKADKLAKKFARQELVKLFSGPKSDYK